METRGKFHVLIVHPRKNNEHLRALLNAIRQKNRFRQSSYVVLWQNPCTKWFARSLKFLNCLIFALDERTKKVKALMSPSLKAPVIVAKMGSIRSWAFRGSRMCGAFQKRLFNAVVYSVSIWWHDVSKEHWRIQERREYYALVLLALNQSRGSSRPLANRVSSRKPVCRRLLSLRPFLFSVEVCLLVVIPLLVCLLNLRKRKLYDDLYSMNWGSLQMRMHKANHSLSNGIWHIVFIYLFINTLIRMCQEHHACKQTNISKRTIKREKLKRKEEKA